MTNSHLRKVLLTTDTVGGVWTFATELASSLCQQGIQVHMAAIGPSINTAQVECANSIPGLSWMYRASKLEWMEAPWRDIQQTGLWLRSIAQDFQPHVVHLNTLSYGNLDFGVPVVQSIHSCVCSWWAAVKQSELPVDWSLYRDHVRSSLQHADILTAPSSSAVSDVARHYRLKSPNIVRVYNGIDSSAFRSTDKERLILSAGRLWDEAKNLIVLANNAAALSWPVYLAGNPFSPDGSVTAFEHCHLLGELSREELRGWYARASIYVLPAKYEPFGLSVLEAALSGCALVLGDIPSLREIWGDAAVFVSPVDSEALHRAIQNLIDNSEYRKSMSERAACRAAKFSVSRMASSYLHVYESALAYNNKVHACAS